MNKYSYIAGLIILSLMISFANARTISFSGYTWSVKSTTSSKAGPGPNWFGGNTNQVWADSSGLHMTITTTGSKYYCTEVFLPGSLGYGTYFMHTRGRFDTMDKNIVAGFFTYENDTRELDIEFSRWGNVATQDLGYTVQPSPHVTYPLTQSGSNQDLTLLMTWMQGTVIFATYYGYQPWGNLTALSLVGIWTTTSANIPPVGAEKYRINFWLMSGLTPSNGQTAEFIVTDFSFYSNTVPIELSGFAIIEEGTKQKDNEQRIVNND